MNRFVVTTVVAVCYTCCGSAIAAPEAGVTADSWSLDVTFHDPRRISLTLPGDSRETTYWYLLFTVANNTGRDLSFYPSFRLVTDTLAVVEGGADVNPRVYDAIFERHARDYPFIATPSKVTGPLLQGEDNARTSVAVFRMFDAEASGFTVYLGGLSGDMARVRNPDFSSDQVGSETNPHFFLLRRTLAIEYDLPGDPVTRVRANPIRRVRRWVMR